MIDAITTKSLVLSLALTISMASFTDSMAQGKPSPVNKIDHPEMLRRGERRNIRIPDMLGYKSLKGDFHLHTVFSDGAVWPTVRVDEAWQNGMDVIAITDHIEYLSHTAYLKGDHNSSYNIAAPRAAELGVLLIKASELTHGDKAKGGHINALFITDANPLERPKGSETLQESVDEANKQGAFLIWNHPGWAVDSCAYHPISAKWVAEGKIHAVELFNEKEYYPRAATWCAEQTLAPVAASDAHSPMSALYADGVMQPFTVVLATDNSLEAIREALFARRTIAVFNGEAVATAPLLEALFAASTTVSVLPNGQWAITNNSDIPFAINSAGFNRTLLPNNTLQIAPPKDGTAIDAEIGNLHITESTNLKTKISPSAK